jgi:hypothetical protein
MYFGVNRGRRPHVRYWPKADVEIALTDVCFRG